jgi:UPF0716 protein FxsA
VQKSLTLKLMPHLAVYRPGGWGQNGGAANGNTFDGEFQRKQDDRYTLDHQPDDRDKRDDR